MFKFIQRSEENLRGVNPVLVKVVRRALELTSKDFIVIEGKRTEARQLQLVLNGKSKTMNSRHLSGNAIDVLPLGVNWDNYKDWLPVLCAVHEAAKELGVTLRFGITWTDDPNDPPAKFLDAPHIEIPA